MSEKYPLGHAVFDDPEEFDRAQEIENRILSRQPKERRGCPFCGHQKLETIIRPKIGGNPMQPVIMTQPNGGFWAITVLVCDNCGFIMPFMENDRVLKDGEN